MKIVDGCYNQSENSTVIWFIADEYPDDTFGIKYFVNAKYKKFYIIPHPNNNYEEKWKKLMYLDSNLQRIKNEIVLKLPNYPRVQLKILYTPYNFSY